ncbi:hypothetical protein DMN91_006838 [Ooceraea biroi]|uniref:Phospholipase B1, membrane-associated n=1 Tax=Ooceraea biroi TaxID=2015173 RepID=A0A3L8DIP9_OOCBI|nr:hypothetical protein DMN91_006838 [Ooceraea biroi]
MTSCQSSILDMPIAVDLLRVIRNWGLSAFVLVGRSSKVPDSVHKLRPGDIDVLGAMGDSVTAGAGVFGTNTFHIAVDNRGATAVAGGQGTWKQYLTVPNILKVNHEARRRFSWNHLTNRARRDCAGAAKKNHKECSFSRPRYVYAPLMDGTQGRLPSSCYMSLINACGCMIGLAYKRVRPTYDNIIRRWQEIDMEIATYPEFQRDDFVVVAQPVLMDLTIPLKSNGKVDLTYLSADCFHISQKLNAWCKSHKTYYFTFADASFLWESLFQPVGAKMTKLTDNPPSEKFYCPTEKRPYLATMLNSRK